MSTVVLAGAMRDKYAKGEKSLPPTRRSTAAEVWDMNAPFWDAGAVVGMLEKSGMVDVEIVREDKCFVMLAGRRLRPSEREPRGKEETNETREGGRPGGTPVHRISRTSCDARNSTTTNPAGRRVPT